MCLNQLRGHIREGLQFTLLGTDDGRFEPDDPAQAPCREDDALGKDAFKLSLGYEIAEKPSAKCVEFPLVLVRQHDLTREKSVLKGVL